MSALAIVFICIASLLIILIVLYFQYNNREIALRKESEAQRGKIEAVRDQMFKVLQEKADVASDYREAFGKIFPDIIAGRYAHDRNDMMKWIQEANPNFDTSLYKDLMIAIEAQRAQFMNVQARMLDIINQRATLIESYPSCWFVKNKQDIPYEVISSAATKTVMGSGIDDFTIRMR